MLHLTNGSAFVLPQSCFGKTKDEFHDDLPRLDLFVFAVNVVASSQTVHQCPPAPQNVPSDLVISSGKLLTSRKTLYTPRKTTSTFIQNKSNTFQKPVEQPETYRLPQPGIPQKPKPEPVPRVQRSWEPL